MKGKCCPNTTVHRIARSVHEAARDVARRIAKTPKYVRSRHERKKVEILFAHLKRILKLDRLRLRGMSGATDEFTLAAAVQNLRRPRQTYISRAARDRISTPVSSKNPQINHRQSSNERSTEKAT
jgi:hypothetical protein